MFLNTGLCVVETTQIRGMSKSMNHYERHPEYELKIVLYGEQSMHVDFDSPEERDSVYDLIVNALMAR